MRDKWHFHLSVGWYKLTIAERGLVSTLYASGEEITVSWDDADTIFGSGWKPIADKLAGKKVIYMESPSLGIFTLKLKIKNAARREYHRTYSKSNR